MTTYHCPVCNQSWSMGPTRDHQEGTCGRCANRQIEASPFLDKLTLAKEVFHLRRVNSLLEDALKESQERNTTLLQSFAKELHNIEQTLGKALGYPYFYLDQKNFPGSTVADGVCIGEHVAATLAQEAAERIAKQDEAVQWYAVRAEMIQHIAYTFHADIARQLDSIFKHGYISSR